LDLRAPSNKSGAITGLTQRAVAGDAAGLGEWEFFAARFGALAILAMRAMLGSAAPPFFES
jgi:hypothetical protein